MRTLAPLLLAGLCLGSVAAGQSAVSTTQSTDVEQVTKPIPHPFLYLGPSLFGGGYAVLAYRAEAGFDLESRHAIVRAIAAYDNAHKTDDNNQPNPKGHDRYLEGAAYYRTSLFSHPGWFFGMGWRWNELSTTNYLKHGSRAEIGGGYDIVTRRCPECRRRFSMRVNADWVLAGTDWQNGSHGPSITVTLPTPSEKRHLFFRENIGIYRFHDTVTDPANLALTRWQRDQRSITSYADFGAFYRF